MKVSKEVVAIGVVAGLVIWWLNEERKKNERIALRAKLERDLYKKAAQRQSRHIHNLHNQLQEIASRDGVSEAIKEQLDRLFKEYKNIDSDIAAELIEASALFSMDMKSKAIHCLGKILENIVKRKIKGDVTVSSTTFKNMSFSDCLDHLKSKKAIKDTEYHLASALRTQRNSEGHELNVEIDELSVSGIFLGSINLILKIGRWTPLSHN